MRTFVISWGDMIVLVAYRLGFCESSVESPISLFKLLGTELFL